MYKLNSSEDIKELADGNAVDIRILAKNDKVAMVKKGELNFFKKYPV